MLIIGIAVSSATLSLATGTTISGSKCIWHYGRLLLFLSITLVTHCEGIHAQDCAALHGSLRVALVTAADMRTHSARLQVFERASPHTPWKHRDRPIEVVIGSAGMGWGYEFRHLAKGLEPMKVEGDRRTPAGIFRLGPSFGFEPSTRLNYLHIKDETICVDEPSSPAYNTITSRTIIGHSVSAEKMHLIHGYRRGLVIRYKSDGASRAGSCIFLHVWQDARRGTLGCVAAPVARIAVLQHYAASSRMAIAILPEAARARFDCLPLQEPSRR